MEALCTMVAHRTRLVEFLLRRSNGKPILMAVLKEMVSTEYKATNLPIIEAAFDKVNAVYQSWVKLELQNQTATPSSTKAPPKGSFSARVLIDQTDVHLNVLYPIQDKEHFGKIVMVYLNSLTRHSIVAQHAFSKMIVSELINTKKFETLLELFHYALINESKPLAISLLSLSNLHPIIGQMVLDMLAKLGETEIILEVLLEQGKVMDALRIAKNLPTVDQISARKYLEAAVNTGDSIVFHSVYAFFQQRNCRLRGNPDFLRSE